MTLILSKEELVILTGKERSKAQGRALAHMGIPYRTRPDGSPVVVRVQLEAGEASGLGEIGVASARLVQNGRTSLPQLQP
jgi:Domain of unknown function (DUF4224)